MSLLNLDLFARLESRRSNKFPVSLVDPVTDLILIGYLFEHLEHSSCKVSVSATLIVLKPSHHSRGLLF